MHHSMVENANFCFTNKLFTWEKCEIYKHSFYKAYRNENRVVRFSLDNFSVCQYRSPDVSIQTPDMNSHQVMAGNTEA